MFIITLCYMNIFITWSTLLQTTSMKKYGTRKEWFYTRIILAKQNDFWNKLIAHIWIFFEFIVEESPKTGPKVHGSWAIGNTEINDNFNSERHVGHAGKLSQNHRLVERKHKYRYEKEDIRKRKESGKLRT